MLKNAFTAVLILCGVLVLVMSCQSDYNDKTDEHSDDFDDDSVDDESCDDNLTKGEIWVDPATNLTWQTGSSCHGHYYDDAVAYCKALEIDGFSDWRLPSISEMRSLIRGCPATETDGECPLTDECQDWSECKDGICNGCEEDNGPTSGCYGPLELDSHCRWFWTANEDICVRFDRGGIVRCDTGGDGEGEGWSVRCTRP